MELMDPRLLGMACVLGSSLIEAVAQIAFKMAAAQTGEAGMMTGVHSLRRAPGWLLAGVACIVVEAVMFSVALRLLDVSIAFPAGSLTFVGVVILSRWWLREAVGARRWAGVGLIVAGTILLGAS